MTMAEPIEATSTAAAPLEVVETPAPVPATVTQQDQAAAAIVAASEAALANPGMPGRDEFLTLATTARMLCLSGAAPKAVRNNPYVAFHIAMVGRDLGISPSAALELIDVIDGQNGPRLSLSPQLINAQIRRLGLGSIVPAIQTAERCVAVALGPHGKLDIRCKRTWPDHAEGCACADILGDYEWTWEDAQMANLAGNECAPGNHSIKCSSSGSDRQFKCSQGNKTYPKRMHWWRASGYLADDVFPEAGLGLYTAEELGATVDDEGRAIDVASVDLPDGYQQALPPPNPNNEAATDEDKWNLKLRIMALPDDIGAELRETWKKSDKVSAVDKLTAAGMKVAQAMVSGAESKARTKHKDWNSAKAIETIAATVVANLSPPWSAKPDSAPTPTPPPESGAPAPASTDQTAEPSTARKSALSGPDSTPDGERGHAAPEPTDEDLEGASPKLINDVIAEVLAMKAHDVDKALTGYKLHTEGELDTRKRRLTLAIVRARKTTT